MEVEGNIFCHELTDIMQKVCVSIWINEFHSKIQEIKYDWFVHKITTPIG